MRVPIRSGRRRAARPVPALAATAAVTAAALAALTACSSSSGSSAGGSPSGTATGTPAPGAAKLSGTVTVFAAASLKESFTTLGERFEAAHPGVKVTFDFAGSDTLAASIRGGAPADVFAAASAATMDAVTSAGDAAGAAVPFARNRLEIATLPGNPDHIASLRDLTSPELKVALCARTVPCGAAAQKALAASHLSLTPVTYEQDVKAALTKVELKEVDAAVVYRTDVQAAGGKVTGVGFPESAQALNSYPVVRLKAAPDAAGADAFIAFVRSSAGRQVLRQAGFLNP